MTLVRIVPGSMWVAREALDLFGTERVRAGSWGSPVWAHDLSDDEADFAKEFFAELGCRVIVEKI